MIHVCQENEQLNIDDNNFRKKISKFGQSEQNSGHVNNAIDSFEFARSITIKNRNQFEEAILSIKMGGARTSLAPGAAPRPDFLWLRRHVMRFVRGVTDLALR